MFKCVNTEMVDSRTLDVKQNYQYIQGVYCKSELQKVAAPFYAYLQNQREGKCWSLICNIKMIFWESGK